MINHCVNHSSRIAAIERNKVKYCWFCAYGESWFRSHFQMSSEEFYERLGTEEQRTPRMRKKEEEVKTSEKKEKTKGFVPPTLDEIQAYIFEKKLLVDGAHFLEYFTAGNWIDSNGKKVISWKQKLLTWNGHGKQSKAPVKATVIRLCDCGCEQPAKYQQAGKWVNSSACRKKVLGW